MSSVKFSVRIRPEPLARRLLSVSAMMCYFWGFLLLVVMPGPWYQRLLLAGGWLLLAAVEWRRYRSAAADLGAIVVDEDRACFVEDASGRVWTAELLPGSVLTRKLLFLRLKRADGRQFVEFLPRFRVKARDWHRLQLIWQHARPAVGSARGS